VTQKWNVVEFDDLARWFRLSNGAARCPFLRGAISVPHSTQPRPFISFSSLADWLSVRVDQAGERSRVCLHNDAAVAGTNVINAAFQLSKRAGKLCRYWNVYNAFMAPTNKRGSMTHAGAFVWSCTETDVTDYLRRRRHWLVAEEFEIEVFARTTMKQALASPTKSRAVCTLYDDATTIISLVAMSCDI